MVPWVSRLFPGSRGTRTRLLFGCFLTWESRLSGRPSYSQGVCGAGTQGSFASQELAEPRRQPRLFVCWLFALGFILTESDLCSSGWPGAHYVPRAELELLTLLPLPLRRLDRRYASTHLLQGSGFLRHVTRLLPRLPSAVTGGLSCLWEARARIRDPRGTCSVTSRPGGLAGGRESQGPTLAAIM